jgi:hypothetical protein
MALTYCDGSSSEFKSTNNYKIDELVKMFEISPADVANIQAWKELKAKGLIDSEDFKNLTEILAGKIITADAWNKLCDCMINLQQMYVDKGLDKIQTTVEDYVASYTEETKLNETINQQVGTTINNLLLTNATQIIISTTQPAVVNGALWVKPKTT